MSKKSREVLYADELHELYEKLWGIVENEEHYNLSELESDTIRLAGKVMHQLYMAAKFPQFNKKLETGGMVDITPASVA